MIGVPLPRAPERRRERRELRPAIESVGAFARLDLRERLKKSEALSLGEARERGLLRFEPETGAGLPSG